MRMKYSELKYSEYGVPAKKHHELFTHKLDISVTYYMALSNVTNQPFPFNRKKSKP